MKIYKRFLLFLLPAFLFWACVSSVPPVDEKPSAVVVPEEKTPAQAEYAAFPDGLDMPRFRNLPPEARAYLLALAEAFRKKDKDYLISQGETQYEKELRYKYDDETYLAMLYRTGPYSEDSVQMTIALPKLDYSRVRGIEYTQWEERGPMLEIKGRIYLEGGESVSCEIVLIWRLLEQKILGTYP